MTSIALEWNESQLRDLRARGFSKAIVRAARKSGGDALRSMRTTAARYVRERKRVKAGAVRDAMTLIFPRGTGDLADLAWTLKVNNKTVPLAEYPHRQTKRGVSVSVNKGGARKLIEGAFVARMKSGHEGIFVRRGKARLPIDELFSSKITDLFRDTGMVDRTFDRGREVFASSFTRLLPLELKKK